MLCLTIALGVFVLSGYATFSGANKEACNIYAAVGQTLALPLDHKTLAKEDGLRWIHNDTIIFYRYGQTGMLRAGKPEDISAVGYLQLRNPNFTSAGIYRAEVLNENGSTIRHAQTARLCMMERVSKPQVNFVCDFKASTVTLSCNADSPQGLVYTWTHNKKPLTSETRQTLSISLTKLKGENTFSCSVSNKISEKISNNVPVTCSAAVPPPALVCFRELTVVATVAGGGGLILILVIVVVILCSRLCQRKAQMSLEDKGTLPMALVTRKEEADMNSLQYETMFPHGASLNPLLEPSSSEHSRDTSQPGVRAQDGSPHTAGAAEGHQSLPVPKPRTKTPHTQNI